MKEATVDDFARELLDLWESRHMYGYVFVAYAQGKVPVGFILLEDNSFGTYTIRGTWVSEIFRRQGIGSQLMRELFKVSGGYPNRIWVNITPGAEEFYKRFGFKLVGRRTDFNQTIGIFAEGYPVKDLEGLASYRYGTRFEPLKVSLFTRLKKKFKK